MTEITTVSEAFLVAETIEADTRYWLQAAREMYALGHAEGWREGYEAAGRDMTRRWNEIARPVVRRGPDFAELEERRWGPGGRARFGDPRPGDYPGRGSAAA